MPLNFTASDNPAAPITPQSIPALLPQFRDYAGLLMYRSEFNGRPAADHTLEELHNANPSFNIGSMITGLARLEKADAAGRVSYDVYDNEACAADPRKADVKLWHFPADDPKPGAPFILAIAGGAYVSVCTMVESLPVAARFNELGYHVFTLNYRVSWDGVMPMPLEDTAAALRFIHSHADQFGLTMNTCVNGQTQIPYVVCGFSAAANLTCLWGTKQHGYAHYGLPKPEALFPVYPLTTNYTANGARDVLADMMFGKNSPDELVRSYEINDLVDTDYPSTYLTHCKDDPTVPYRNSVLLHNALLKYGVPCELELGEHGGHGFGDGAGSDCAGWPARAARFVEER